VVSLRLNHASIAGVFTATLERQLRKATISRDYRLLDIVNANTNEADA